MSIYSNNNNNSPTDLNAVDQKGNGRGASDACASAMSPTGIDLRMSILHAPWPPDRSKNDLKTQRDRNTSPDWPEHGRITSIEHSPLEDGEIEDDDSDDVNLTRLTEDVAKQPENPLPTDRSTHSIGTDDPSIVTSLKRSLPDKFIDMDSADPMGSEEGITSADYQPASKCDPEIRNERIPPKFPRRSLSGSRSRYPGTKSSTPATLIDNFDPASVVGQGSGMTRHYWGSSAPPKVHSPEEHPSGITNKYRPIGNNDRQGRGTLGGQTFRAGMGPANRSGAMGSGGARKSAPVCRFYLESRCNKGSECPFSHDVQPMKRHELCKFYLNGFCVKHNHCNFMHGEFPCKFFHGQQKKCSNTSGNCRFSHDPITDPRVKEALEKIINESSSDDYDTTSSGFDKSRSQPHQGDLAYRQQNASDNHGLSKPSLLGLPPQQQPNNNQQGRHGDNSAENRQAQGMGGIEKSMFFKDCLSRSRTCSDGASDDKKKSGDVTSAQSTSSANMVTSVDTATSLSAESLRKQIFTTPEPMESFPCGQQEATHGAHTDQSVSEKMRSPAAMPCNVVPHPHSSFPPFSNDHDQRICMSRFDPILNAQMFPHYHWSAGAAMGGCRPDQLNGPSPSSFRHQQQRQQYNLMHQPPYHQRSSLFMHDADIRQCDRVHPAAMLLSRGQDGAPMPQQLYRHPVAVRTMYPMALHHNRYSIPFQPPSSMQLPLMSHPESLLSASMQQGLAALSQPNQMSSAPMCAPMRRMQPMTGLGPMLARVPSHMHQTASAGAPGEFFPPHEGAVNQATDQYSLTASHGESGDDLQRFCPDNWTPPNVAPANPQSQSINEAVNKTLDHISAAMLAALPATDDDVNYDDANGDDICFDDVHGNDTDFPSADVTMGSDPDENPDEDETFSEDSDDDVDLTRPIAVDKSASGNFEALKVLVETIRTEVRKVKRTRGDQVSATKAVGSSSRCTSESALYKQLRQLIITLRRSQRAADSDKNDSPAEPSPPPPTRIRGFTGPFHYRLHPIQLDQRNLHESKTHQQAETGSAEPANASTDKLSPVQDRRLPQCTDPDANLLPPRDPRLYRPVRGDSVCSAVKEIKLQHSELQQPASLAIKPGCLQDAPARDASSRPKDPRLARLRSFELFKNNSGSEHG